MAGRNPRSRARLRLARGLLVGDGMLRATLPATCVLLALACGPTVLRDPGGDQPYDDDTDWDDSYDDGDEDPIDPRDDPDADPGPRDDPRDPNPREEPEEIPLEEEPADLPACPDGTRRIEPVTILAVAPVGIGREHLGRPVDEDFALLEGGAGATLFPRAEVNDNPVASIEHRTHFVENSRSLSANASFFGIGGSVESRSTRRYAVYSALEIAEVAEIDDTGAMEAPPDDAKFYLWRIHYGHSFEAMVSGETRSFHTGVRARFAGASGAITSFADTEHLESVISGRGLEPSSGDAIFARTEDEIERAYRTSGEAVPIQVEYRSVPTACLKEPEEYAWVDPLVVDVRYDRLYVYEDGSLGRDTWSLDASCRVGGVQVFLDDPMVWDMHSDVCDSDRGGLAGPNGDDDYCEYVLGWSTRLEVSPGDTITCGVQGVAWDDNDTVEYSEMSATVDEGMEPMTGQMGAGNGQTEYWLFWSLNPVE